MWSMHACVYMIRVKHITRFNWLQNSLNLAPMPQFELQQIRLSVRSLYCVFINITGILNSWHPVASKTIHIHTLADQDGGVHTAFVHGAARTKSSK